MTDADSMKIANDARKSVRELLSLQIPDDDIEVRVFDGVPLEITAQWAFKSTRAPVDLHVTFDWKWRTK